MCKRLMFTCAVVSLAISRGSEAFCGLRGLGDVDNGGIGDFVKCLKAKAIVTLDHTSRNDTLPLFGSISLVRNNEEHREQRSEKEETVVATFNMKQEQELRTKPEEMLDQMLYDKVFRLFSGRTVQIGLPELTNPEEGRGKMKKTMSMMMTMAAMKAMMIIPLALGVLFLMAGKAMIISKIALVLSLIITLKKLISKSSEHVIHETHSAAAAWPSSGSSGGYGGGGWDKRSSSAVTAGQMMAYNSYKP